MRDWCPTAGPSANATYSDEDETPCPVTAIDHLMETFIGQIRVESQILSAFGLVWVVALLQCCGRGVR